MRSFIGPNLSFDIATQLYSDVKIIAQEIKQLKLYIKKAYSVNLNNREFIMVIRYFDIDHEACKRMKSTSRFSNWILKIANGFKKRH